MGLTASLRRFAASRPHLLLLEEPGGTAARFAVERFAREQGWPLVDGPADADVLVLAGRPVGLAPFADRVWDQLPGPRARVQVRPDDDARTGLESARARLVDISEARRDVRRTGRPPAASPAGSGGHDMAGMDRSSGHDMAGMDAPTGHDMAGTDPHAGHDMEGMDLPAGLGMAERAPDRDGLMLDVLTVPWGPALPCWPAGLVVTTVLQGDVVIESRIERLGDPAGLTAGWAAVADGLAPASTAAVVRLDALSRLLTVAGWEGAQLACVRLRDGLLAGPTTDQLRARLDRFSRRVAGSRSLARMTTGIRTSAGQDVTTRYRSWLTEAAVALGGGVPPVPARSAGGALVELPGLLAGTELGTARLVIASLDLELSGATSVTADV